MDQHISSIKSGGERGEGRGRAVGVGLFSLFTETHILLCLRGSGHCRSDVFIALR